MKPVKRWTALLLVLAMLVTYLPLGVLAEETTPVTEPAQVQQEIVEEATESVAEETTEPADSEEPK